MRIKKLARRGKNSKYVLIDKSILDLLGFGDYVSFELKDDSIIIKPYFGEDVNYAKKEERQIL